MNRGGPTRGRLAAGQGTTLGPLSPGTPRTTHHAPRARVLWPHNYLTNDLGGHSLKMFDWFKGRCVLVVYSVFQMYCFKNISIQNNSTNFQRNYCRASRTCTQGGSIFSNYQFSIKIVIKNSFNVGVNRWCYAIDEKREGKYLNFRRKFKLLKHLLF